MRNIISVGLLALLLATSLAACGRKGKLEPPPGSDPAKSDVKLPDYK